MSLIKKELTEKSGFVMEFSVSKEVYAKAEQAAYKKNVKSIAIPGFRKGKAPKAIIEKDYGKGNHDFWWSTMRKHEAFFEKHGIDTISFLFNNAHEVEDYIIAGPRGWYNDADAANAPDNADFEKLTNRENLRL